MNTYRFDLAWDGTNYSGWQRQPNALSIQEVVEEALHNIFPKEQITVEAAGRTDAGVHALQQVCRFSVQSSREPTVIVRGLNAKLPDDIVCLNAQLVDTHFHPRRHSKEKHYRYRIWRAPVRSVFEHRYTWHLSSELDVDLMRQCAKLFEGTHDFSAFRAAGCSATHTFRTIQCSAISLHESELHFDIQGKGFLRHMVRIMMGTVVAVGQHRISCAEVSMALLGGDRVNVGMTAPAKGLWLVSTSLLDNPIK